MTPSRPDRESCPMRQGNGNCLPAGGFCTANGDEYCKALRNAYDHGWTDAAKRAIRILERHKDAEECRLQGKPEPPNEDDDARQGL